MNTTTRRQFIACVGVSSMGVLAGGCSRKGGGEEVAAVEDLMREHGILRRALLVYAETARKLRQNLTTPIAETLHNTAKLFRSFGEDYHERKLEEVHIFPGLQKGRESMAGLVKTLVAQHERGREVTDYILAVTQQGMIREDKAAVFAQVLDSFVLMYQNHAAREDTVVFPAWKQVLPSGELEEMGERFEAVEHEQFGDDGFEKAVRQIAEIEGTLGLVDIAQFTASPPPRP